jgi:hypothetical protein
MKFTLFIFLLIILTYSFSAITSLAMINPEIRIENSSKNLKRSFKTYSNATVISDGFNNTYWNSQSSEDPSIAVDKNDKVHVVWLDGTDGPWGTDYEIFYVSYTNETGWTNVTVISDGYAGKYWNDGYCSDAAIAVDSENKIHVLWEDTTDGVWGTDSEIFYVSYTNSSGWSNITVISDGYGGKYWNDGTSSQASITVDSNDNLHVCWQDTTDGVWGTDPEIFYVSYTNNSGWSNVTVLSDGYNGKYWNWGTSYNPEISVDKNDNLHVVWEDSTEGIWGDDYEIFYVSYEKGEGWSNVTVISDGYQDKYWNDGDSSDAAIAVDNENIIHVVWQDYTDGEWGIDIEIMGVIYTPSNGWSNVSIISDGYDGKYWNDAESSGPKIISDHNGDVHVVWYDYTDGIWGTDTEIMYANYTSLSGWSNVTIMSDGSNGKYWNNELSTHPSISHGTNRVYIVWEDFTDGVWGTDTEVMCAWFSINPPIPGTPKGGGISFSLIFLIPMFLTLTGIIIFINQKIKNS